MCNISQPGLGHISGSNAVDPKERPPCGQQLEKRPNARTTRVININRRSGGGGGVGGGRTGGGGGSVEDALIEFRRRAKKIAHAK